MYCSNCGNKINDNDKYCSSCGNELSNNELTNKIIDETLIETESIINNQETGAKSDNDEFDVFVEKFICFLKYIKELIVAHKIIFGLCVASLVVICYSIFWTSTLNQAKNLASQGEFVRAKNKVEFLINPFHNKEIEEMIYFGKISFHKECIEKLESNPDKERVGYYRTILENIFEGLRETNLDKPKDVNVSQYYLYYMNKLINYTENVYPIDVLRLEIMSKEEQKNHIDQIAKNIVSQNRINEENLRIAERLQKHDIKIIPSVSYTEDKWICKCSLKIGKNSICKYYDKIEIKVTYYDENYKIIQSDKYIVEDAYSGQYIENIEIISVPKSKVRPFKYQIDHDLY